MTRTGIFFITALLLIIGTNAGTLYAQKNETKGEKLTLEIAADNNKFKNGVRFIELGRLQKAINELNEYLEIFYSGIHRDEAYRRLAEIYYKRMEYLSAIKYFRLLYEEFNNSESGISAYYKIGICYSKMGNEKRAADVYKEIVTDHPDAECAEKCRLQLELIKVLE